MGFLWQKTFGPRPRSRKNQRGSHFVPLTRPLPRKRLPLASHLHPPSSACPRPLPCPLWRCVCVRVCVRACGNLRVFVCLGVFGGCRDMAGSLCLSLPKDQGWGLLCGQLRPPSCDTASWIPWSKAVEDPLWAVVIHQFSSHLEAHPSLHREYKLGFPYSWAFGKSLYFGAVSLGIEKECNARLCVGTAFGCP